MPTMPTLKGTSKSRVSESQIKSVLSAIDKAKRVEDASRQRARLAERARVLSDGKKLLTPYWKKTGLDVAAFEKIQKKAEVEMHRLTRIGTADAIKRSSLVKKQLHYGADNWRKTVAGLQGPHPTLVSQFLPGFEVIHTPFIIWPTHGLELIDSHVESGNNWAKITGQSEASSGSENLRFIFVWENPNDKFTAVNVASFLSLNGSCQVSADGGTAGIFPGGSSNLHLKAFLNVWEWWNQPPTNPVGEVTQTREALNLSADGGGWFGSVGAIVPQSVAGNFDVNYSLFVLPPNGVAVFEVTLLVTYDNDDGRIEIDFSSGSFEVMCPFVAVAILT